MGGRLSPKGDGVGLDSEGPFRTLTKTDQYTREGAGRRLRIGLGSVLHPTFPNPISWH